MEKRYDPSSCLLLSCWLWVLDWRAYTTQIEVPRRDVKEDEEDEEDEEADAQVYSLQIQ